MLNQVFLGNSDPLLSQTDIEKQLNMLKQYEAQLASMQTKGTLQNALVWDSIDQEMSSLTDNQKARFFEDKEYTDITNTLQQMVQVELLNLVKAKVENTPTGKELLQRQLQIVKKLKTKIIQDTDNEMAIFKKFREYSKDNPGLTYEDFLKQWHNM